MCIEGWDQLCADVLEADDHFRRRDVGRAALAEFSLVNRQEGDDLLGPLKMERTFYSKSDQDAAGRLTPAEVAAEFRPDRGPERQVQVIGLDGLLAIQRQKNPLGDDAGAQRQWRVDNALSGLLLIVKYHQAVDRHMGERGLPLPVGLIIQMDQAAWPMESGIQDFGPQVLRRIAAAQPKPAAIDVGAAILAERTKDRRADFQATVTQTIAEYREQYRLVRMFPFYRIKSRNKVGEMFDSLLEMACKIDNLPRRGVGWKMKKPDFERFLRQWAQAQNPPSVEDALKLSHLDRLHEKWLGIARSKDFDLGPTPTSMFELNLAWALKFGGPILQDQWEHAKPYRIDR